MVQDCYTRRLGCHSSSVLWIHHCKCVKSGMSRACTRKPEQALLRVRCGDEWFNISVLPEKYLVHISLVFSLSRFYWCGLSL